MLLSHAPRAGTALLQHGVVRAAAQGRVPQPATLFRYRMVTRDTLFTTNGASNTEPATEAADAPATPTQQQPATPAAADAPPTVAAGTVRSHPLALPDDMFAAEELVAELSDPASLGKRGEAYLAAQLVALLFVVFPPFRLAGLFDLMATLALVAGLVFIMYGAISLGRYISPLPLPRKNHKLVTEGLFAYVRHPIYSGLILAAMGLAAITRSEGRLALAIVLWFVLERKAAFEEAALVARYGEPYKAYAARTKKFVPLVY